MVFVPSLMLHEVGVGSVLEKFKLADSGLAKVRVNVIAEPLGRPEVPRTLKALPV